MVRPELGGGVAVMRRLVAALGVALGAGCTTGRPAFELLRVIEVHGRQGVATDGERYFVSGSRSLYVYDKQGALLAANETPFDALESAANHIGDISVHAGELYAGIEQFLDGAASDIRIAVYDARTLAYLRSIEWSPASGQREVSGVGVDPGGDALWMTDWLQGERIYRYSLSQGTYTGSMLLDPPPPFQQGIAAHGGYLYITADDGDAARDEPDGLWRVPADPAAAAGRAVRVKSFVEFRRAGEIEGLDFDAAAGEMIVLSNRGSHIVQGMPRGFLPGYEREIHELYVYRVP